MYQANPLIKLPAIVCYLYKMAYLCGGNTLKYDMVARRNIIIIIIIVVTIVILLMRLFFIQVLDESYKITAANNAFRYDVEYPARGIIYDRNKNILVENTTTYDIMITPRELKDIDTAELCTIFRLSPEEVKNIFKDLGRNRSYRAFTFLKQVAPERYAMFKERADRFPGFYAVVRTMRVYPRKVGGNVLGYIKEADTATINRNQYYKSGDYIGCTGIEESYEEVLRGKKGLSIYLRDSRNRIVEPYEGGRLDTSAVSGKNITSSIDADLQEYVQLLMQNKVGSVVAIEPSTGEILALVSSPTFDPALLSGLNRGQNFNALDSDPTHPLYNRAIMSRQPPGSTFKLVNGLIALQEETLTTTTHYHCGGRYPYGKGVGCHGHLSPVNFTNSIMVSCNSYYCHVFRNILENKKYSSTGLALDAWREKVQRFGFARKLGIDLPGEKEGIIASKQMYDKRYGENRWNPLTVISLAIGQGEIVTTILQLANMCATIANKGYYYIPHIVKAVGDGEKIAPEYYEKQYCGIDEKYFDHTIQGMYMAVNGIGTAWRVRLPDIELCGKTGTAENPHGKNHSVFVCFAPKNNPKIAVAALIENSGAGASFAAPVSALTVEKYLKGKISRTDLEQFMLGLDLVTNNPLYARK
ncbi:MAG: penicillin-binding protein 2 [Prevotellaceae bacterium]|jgi:penicillin-binding protein 2|nr:penicillin-binding protein 2 [Prevotellaceae bacterium]